MFSDNSVLRRATKAVEERLPPRWSVELERSRGAVSMRFSAADGRHGSLPAVIKHRIDPRVASQLAPSESLVIAPYLSKSVRDLLEARGFSYLDPTGNVRIVVAEPGLFVLTSGADANPWPEERRHTLRGVKAGRVVRALATAALPLGVRELADLAGTDPGYVSRLLAKLDSDALVDRTKRGRVEHVRWRKLLISWSEDAPLSSRSIGTAWLAPRGFKGVFDQLRKGDVRYAITGSAVAAKFAPIAPTRLVSVYSDDAVELADILGLRAADAGANMILLEHDDESVYEHAVAHEGLLHAPLALVVSDLLTGPGRSPSEADALMDWMAANEEAWRG